MYVLKVKKIKVQVSADKVIEVEIPVAVAVPDKKKWYERVPVPEWFKNGLVKEDTV